jgi:hypothetical protein
MITMVGQGMTILMSEMRKKKVKYKERNNWKKNLYLLLIWLLWNVSLNKDNLWDIYVITGGTIGMVH